MKNYTMIRGAKQAERCTNKSTYGSPLYCKCGCQTPIDSDPDINLDGVVVSGKATKGYANYNLSRNGQQCGSINIQHNYIYLDGYEFLGVDNDYIKDLLVMARNIKTDNDNLQTGDSLEDTAAHEHAMDAIANMEQNKANKNHPGYCPICHSYCYGDCEA